MTPAGLRAQKMTTLKSIGRNLRRARESAGMNVCELSRATGITRQTFYRMEAGKDYLLSNLLCAAKAVGVPLEDICK